MKTWLAQHLICPQCLPNENSLELTIEQQTTDDILNGELCCPVCEQTYAIKDGVAMVLPKESITLLSDDSGYNSKGMISSYLWSHFCDLLHDPDATQAYKVWSSSFKTAKGIGLDIGCSVGRLTFEMSPTHDQVIGIDTSRSFIQKARQLLNRKRLDFELIIEGQITENRSIEFNNGWQYDRIEFLVADAMALPFPNHFFSTIASINILEKVPDPLKHFTEINRVMTREKAMFIFSDPFSWDESVSSPDSWLSGTPQGKYQGRGIDTIKRIITGLDQIMDPPMTVTDQQDVAWKIRKTQNLWEYINSQMIIGTRT
ncbi:MAG: methyltransferase domain-containing protein [Pseudomonadota bacterium]